MLQLLHRRRIQLPERDLPAHPLVCGGMLHHAPSNASAQDAGLSATLAGTSEKATVFAPTDNAFSNLLTAIGLTAQQLLADPSTLGEARPHSPDRTRVW